MTAPSAMTREEIARIIDPIAFAVEGQWMEMSSHAGGRHKALAKADAILSRLPAQASQEEIATIAGWALCAEENGGGPGKCDLNKCVCGSEGKAVARALVGRLPAQAVGEGERRAILEAARDMGAIKSLAREYSKGLPGHKALGMIHHLAKEALQTYLAALPSPSAEPSGEMVEAKARELALARGHRNPDELISVVGGERLPVWMFYFERARAALSSTGKKP